MLEREKFEVEFARLFERYKMGSTVFSPMAGGLLTGKYNEGIPEGSRYDQANPFMMEMAWKKLMGEGIKEKTVAKLNALTDVAKEIGSTLGNLALAWVIANKDVSVCIFGAKNKDQVLQNTQSIETYKKLTPEILERIEKILDNRPSAGINYRDLTPIPPRR